MQGQGQEAVGGWREAGIVGAFLVFAMIVFGLATIPWK